HGADLLEILEPLQALLDARHQKGGSGAGPTFVSTTCAVVEVMRKSWCMSAPPQQRLPQTSGVATTPRRSPSGVSTQTPPGPVTQTLPSSSHSMPSTLPSRGTPVPTPSAMIRRFDGQPSGPTSNTFP